MNSYKYIFVMAGTGAELQIYKIAQCQGQVDRIMNIYFATRCVYYWRASWTPLDHIQSVMKVDGHL